MPATRRPSTSSLTTGNVFTNGNAGQAAVNSQRVGGGQGTFNVRNITTTVRASHGINVALTTNDPAASLRGTIANNNLSTGVANNAGSGINMVLEGAGTMVVDVNNNTINGTATNQFDYGIRGGARAGTGTADFQIREQLGAFDRSRGCLVLRGQCVCRRNQSDVRQLRQQPD